MPRYSFGKEGKKMPKSLKLKTTNSEESSPKSTSPSDRSSQRTRPAPTPSNTKQSAKKKSDAKTPSSILRSSRFGIAVKRTGRGDDGFADDSPFWNAAKEAITQERKTDVDRDSSDDEELVRIQQQDRKASKKREKQRKKRLELEAARQKFEKNQAAMKPNFKVGSQSDGSDGFESDSKKKSNRDRDDNKSPEWLNERFRELKEHKKRRGSRSAVYSPSDLSRASTIPPTPAAKPTPKSAAKSQSETDNREVDQDSGNFDNGDDYNSTNNDYGLSPVREDTVAKEVIDRRALMEQEVYEMEDNIEDVANQASLQENGDGNFNTKTKANNSSDLPNENEQSFQQHDDYSDGGEDDVGGFELRDDPISPSLPSPPSSRQSHARERKEKSPELNADDNSSSSSESSQDTDRRKTNNSKKKKSVELDTPKEKKAKKKRGRPKKVTISTAFNTGYPTGNREYTTIPATEYELENNDDGNVRRSRRRKFPPLAYWKNEKVLYEANREEGSMAEVFGDMPMVAGIQQAEPTPYKKREVRRKVYSDDEDEDGKGKNKSRKQKGDNEITPYDSRKLRKKFNINDGDTAPVWMDGKETSLDQKIICYREGMELHELPLKKRKKGDSKIPGRAGQAFNAEPDENNAGYIVGCLELPPLGIKAEESVGPCFQIFNVGDCQPKSVELALADPELNGGNFDPKTARRFLLSKGDMFHIPPANVYQVQNHSKTNDCSLTWTIVRPPVRQEE